MTTNLYIRGREYDLEDTFQNAKLNVLVYMAKRLGVTLKTITRGLDDMDRRSRLAAQQRRQWRERLDAGEDMTDVEDPPGDYEVMIDMLSTEEGTEVFRGLVWLAKTQAGERGDGGRFLTLEEACEDIGFGDFEFRDPLAELEALDIEDAEIVDDLAPKDEPALAGSSSPSTT